MSILRHPPLKTPRQQLRALERKMHKPAAYQESLGFSRKRLRSVGIGLAAAAALLFATEAEAFHNACDRPRSITTIAQGKDVAFLFEKRRASHIQTERFVLAGPFALKFLRKGIAVSGDTSLAITFRNPGMGTAFDSATGWLTFGLKPGCRRIYCDNVNGNDANTGLSPSQAKQTFKAAAQLWLDAGGSWQQSDQLLLAQSSTMYVDDGTVGQSWTQRGGFSAIYPTALLSYDPSDPPGTTSGDSKIGRATGATMPIINHTDPSLNGPSVLSGNLYFGGSVSFWSDNYAIQGVGLYRDESLPNGPIQTMVGRRHNIVYQNMRVRFSGLGIQPGGDVADGGPFGVTNVLYSKMSIFGGNGAGLYIEKVDGLWIEDVVFYHCGWPIGTTRHDQAYYFDHDAYLHAGSTNINLSRTVHIDGANDALNARSSTAVKQMFCWEMPIALVMGGWSSSNAEAPNGVTVTVDDVVLCGGADISDVSGLNRNWASQWLNTLQGSYINNMVGFDSAFKNGSTACLFNGPSDDTLIANQYLTASNIRMYNFGSLFERTYPSNTPRHLTVNNARVDTLTNEGTPSGTVLNDVSVHSGATTYPNAVTRLQFAQNVATAMGLSSSGTYLQVKERIVNMLLFRPDKSWSPMLIKQSMPKFGLTPAYATLDFPDMSAITPPSVFSAVA